MSLSYISSKKEIEFKHVAAKRKQIRFHLTESNSGKKINYKK